MHKTKNSINARSKIIKAERLLNQNKLKEAHQLCTKLCLQHSTNATAWQLLAMTERRLQNYAAAIKAIERTIQLKPLYPLAHKTHGTILYLQGDLVAAINRFQEAAKLASEDAEIHYLLGNAFRETGAMANAISAYSDAIKQNPNYLEALCNQGATLITMNRYDEAFTNLTKANRLKPGIPQIICNLAMLENAKGKPDSAEELCQQALTIDPNFLDAIVLVAALHEKSGQYEKAQQWVDCGLKLSPDNISLNITASLIERHEGKTGTAITRLENLRSKYPEVLQQDILLLLGQLFDDEKNSDKAFSCLIEGNRLKEASLLTAATTSQNYLDDIRKLLDQFKADNPADWQIFPEDNFTDNPVFLFGFPRSGTTLLEQILDSHPKLQSMSEKPAISAVEKALNGKPLSALNYKDIQKLRKVYFSEVSKYIDRDPKLTLVDKMPLNTVTVPLIWRLFPNAKCILAIRHPCDAVFSCFMQSFVLNQDVSTFYTLEKTADAYHGVMSLWQNYISALPINYHRIRYEDLVFDQTGESKKLIDFLELDWDERVLSHDTHAKSQFINTPSYHQVTRPIYQDAKYRWKRYEKYMQAVIPVLQPFINYFDYEET